MAKEYKLRYFEPAENSLAGWVNRSFMLGNGYFGVNVFGGAAEERLSFSEQSLCVSSTRFINERYSAGNECFSFLYINTKHNDVRCKHYKRELCLNTGVATVEYDYEDIHYTREFFTSYPDGVFVARLTASASGALSFTLRPRLAYERDYLVVPSDGFAKHADITPLDENTLEMRGMLSSYDMQMNMFTRVIADDGDVRIFEKGGLPAVSVEGASQVYVLVSLGTNYDMNKVIFRLPPTVAPNQTKNNELLKNCPSRRDIYLKRLEDASAYTYAELKKRHLEDFENKFNRVQLDWGGTDDGSATNKLLLGYKNGTPSAYLEELHFQMGRYMLLSASRDGGLPANLQGIWNMFGFAPWTCGFWYNINIQMNYWPAFVCNLEECFTAYHNFNVARFEGCSKLADLYIQQLHEGRYTKESGSNGWIVGTGNSAMHLGAVGGHSGPGTGGLTTKAYWEWYDFTRDAELLKTQAYPFLEAVARFYTKCVEKIDGKLLVTHSSSPEQKIDGVPYVTVGCGFDQQMLAESIADYIKATQIIGVDSPLVDRKLYEEAKAQLDLYDPIRIGASGQVKEYREENEYGEFGELDHRHISQLVGAFPGTLLSRRNPAWSDSAKETVILRGLNSGKGWSKAHKILVLARNNGANEAVEMAEAVLRENVFDNLWNDHCGVAVFQADANFGMTAAYAELMLQSHEGFIDVLPQLPAKWNTGSFDGLRARGNFEVGATWENAEIKQLRIFAKVGGICKVRCRDLSAATVSDASGRVVCGKMDGNGILMFDSKAGEHYTINGVRNLPDVAFVEKLCATNDFAGLKLTWAYTDASATFDVYKAEDSAPDYTLLAKKLNTSFYIDKSFVTQRATYKVCVSGSKEGAVTFAVK